MGYNERTSNITVRNILFSLVLMYSLQERNNEITDLLSYVNHKMQ